MPRILAEWIALSLYTLFMGFCFCDGFGLHIIRKLVWFSVFLAVCFYTFTVDQHFDLILIISISSLAAIIVCAYDKITKKRK